MVRYTKREIEPYYLIFKWSRWNEKVFPAKGRVRAVFDPSMKWQLVEEYGVGSFEEQSDGSLLFEHEYADDEGL